MFSFSPKRLVSKGAVYKILSVLKNGEEVKVYKALRGEGPCQNEVAVKIFSQDSELFYQEWKSLRKARSIPACVRLLGEERFKSGPALILESIQGITLLELLKGGALSENEIAFIIRSLSESLKALSLHGLCHGDLSLSNVLINAEGRIRLIDFGEANKKCQGTAPFTAPEIRRGARAGLAGDIFALGVIEICLKNVHKLHSLSENQNLRPWFNQSPLLMEDPALRRLPESLPGPPPPALKQKCIRLLALKEEISETSKPLKGAPGRGKRSKALLTVWMGFFIALTADGGHSSSPQTGFLKTRTDQWFHITVEGFERYTPFSIPLSSGHYKILWKNKRKQGQKTVYISPGKTLILNDQDFTAKP